MEQNLNQNKSLFRATDGKNYLLPFILVTTLFFLWGFANSILDVLNKHFQDTMDRSKTESAFVQAAVYGGYFLMALPAGAIIRRFGYRWGVLTGLLLFGAGSLLFVPGDMLHSFPFFIFSLFVIGCGLTCLETAANPYVTVLGSAEGAARRINLSQSFNGLGQMVGPLVGSWFLFVDSDEGSLSRLYALIGLVVLCVAAVFTQVKLPEVETQTKADTATSQATSKSSLWQHRNFTFGMLALFLYVAAQTGINSFFINYATTDNQMSNAMAANLLSFGGMGLFMIGRMCGSVVMARIRAEYVLLACAIGGAVSMGLLLMGNITIGIAAFFVCYFCESIMFPTIFALALRGVGEHTKIASSLLIMCIVGGAVAPLLMGMIADAGAMAQAFIVPLVCFVVIAAYARFGVSTTHHE